VHVPQRQRHSVISLNLEPKLADSWDMPTPTITWWHALQVTACLVLWFVNAWLCARTLASVMHAKGKAHPQWFTIGFATGPLGVLIGLLAGPRGWAGVLDRDRRQSPHRTNA
jgi:hypothetical protein